jgi:hypothetical protein
MRWRSGTGLLAAAGIGLAAIVADVAAAQDTAPPPRARPHIRVYPLSRYYRKCDFWLAVEHRPSGDVITPQQRCIWALR